MNRALFVGPYDGVFFNSHYSFGRPQFIIGRLCHSPMIQWLSPNIGVKYNVKRFYGTWQITFLCLTSLPMGILEMDIERILGVTFFHHSNSHSIMLWPLYRMYPRAVFEQCRVVGIPTFLCLKFYYLSMQSSIFNPDITWILNIDFFHSTTSNGYIYIPQTYCVRYIARYKEL